MKVDRVGPERIYLRSEPPGEAKQEEKLGRRTGRRVWKQVVKADRESGPEKQTAEAPRNPGRVSDGAKVSGSGLEGSIQERLSLGRDVFRHERVQA